MSYLGLSSCIQLGPDNGIPGALAAPGPELLGAVLLAVLPDALECGNVERGLRGEEDDALVGRGCGRDMVQRRCASCQGG